MALNKHNYNKRCKLIYEDYCALWGEGLRDDVIFKELFDKWHLQPKTLSDIVRKMRRESQEVQPEIPFENHEQRAKSQDNED